MIFVTLGTEQFPFERMVKGAELVKEQVGDEEVFVQIGTHPDPPANCQWQKWLPYPEFAQRVRDARIVITHAGAGSLLSCAWIHKVAITVPRRHRYGEHVDDHQTELAAKMAELGHAILVESAEEIAQAVAEYDERVAALRQRGVSKPTLSDALTRFLEESEKRPS